MNKAEMVGRLAARTGLSKSVAREAVDGVFAATGDALANGEEVRIAGFGRIRDLRHQKQAGPHRTQPEDRRGGFDIGVDIAHIQGREGAAGCRQWRCRVMTLQRQPSATGDDSERLDVDFSRLLCDDGDSASRRDGPGQPRTARGLTGGRLPVWMVNPV